VIVRADLLADRGAGAESDDFFRCRRFLDAEGVTHTLRLEGKRWAAAVPLIVREIEGSELVDAVTPYGYPGALVSGSGGAPQPGEVDWSPTGLVSIFARERLQGEPWLAASTARSELQVHDPALERRIRPRLVEQVRAAVRRGWEVEAVGGPRVGDSDLDSFAVAYEQTMLRANAAPRYFFDRSYLRAALDYERSWLLVARRDGAAGAGAIVAVSDGLLHYYLGGTSDAWLEESPFKNVVVAMLDLADELGVPLNLGGGVRVGDGLESFKRGFANASLPFRTHEVICDPVEYERLTADLGPTEYFPAYRAP
jgi:Acetyltransferase (GNAT) domain